MFAGTGLQVKSGGKEPTLRQRQRVALLMHSLHPPSGRAAHARDSLLLKMLWKHIPQIGKCLRSSVFARESGRIHQDIQPKAIEQAFKGERDVLGIGTVASLAHDLTAKLDQLPVAHFRRSGPCCSCVSMTVLSFL